MKDKVKGTKKRVELKEVPIDEFLGHVGNSSLIGQGGENGEKYIEDVAKLGNGPTKFHIGLCDAVEEGHMSVQ